MEKKESVKLRRLLFAAALLLVLALPGAAVASANEADQHARHFEANLKFANEVAPAGQNPVDANCRARATFQLNRDGTKLFFRLEEAGLATNITQSHIHEGAAGTNGPVVAFLFPNATSIGGVDPENFEVQGTITAAQLVGPLAGQPLSALVAQIRAGNTYVNIHTIANPAGACRGQIMADEDV